MDEALSKAQSENKPVMVDFYTDWCNPCRQMDKYTYSDDAVSPLLNEDFIFLKVNVDKSNLDGRFGRFWCCYLCPLGAIFGAFNPVSILKVKVDFSKCNRCENCLKVCSAKIEKLEEIENCTDCTRCGKCIDSCGSEAVKISASFKE